MDLADLGVARFDPVVHNEDFVFFFLRHDADGQICWQQDAGGKRSIRRRIHGSDRRYLQKLQPGVYDGAAQRVVVGRTSCRCGDQDPVAAELFDGNAVDAYVQVHRIGLASLDDDLVEPDMAVGSSVLGGDFCSNRIEMLDRVQSVFIVGDKMIQIIWRKLLEKSQVTGVDADDGTVREAAGMNGFQQRTVPADADDQLCIVGLFSGHGIAAIH